MGTRADRRAKSDRPCAVLVCSYHEPLRSTVLPLARSLDAAGSLRPLVVLEDDPAGQMAQMCATAGVASKPFHEWGSSVSRNRPLAATAGPGTGPRQGAKTRRDRIMRRLVRLGSTAWKLQGQIRRRTSVLRRLRAEVVVLLDDRTVHGCRWIRAAEQLGLPTVVTQWAATHRAPAMTALRAVRRQTVGTGRLGQRFEHHVARRVPQAVREVEGQPVWWVPAEVALAHHWLGTFPRTNPWTYGGGNSTVVAVLGEAWRQRLVDDGVAAKKIVVTGHPEQDRWFRLATAPDARRPADLARSLGIPAHTRLVTVIAPALVLREPGGARQDDITMANLRADLGAVVRAIQTAGDRCQAVVKVHPRDQVRAVDFLHEAAREGAYRPPLIVDNFPLDQLVAASRAVVCQWSTAALIGQALAVPVVVFDFHHSPSADLWRDVDGLHHAESIGHFQALIGRSLGTASEQARLLAGRQQFVQRYLCLDGNACQRLTTLVERQARRAGDPAPGRRKTGVAA